jgi:hypothetical protein
MVTERVERLGRLGAFAFSEVIESVGAGAFGRFGAS